LQGGKLVGGTKILVLHGGYITISSLNEGFINNIL
jgi:hypothetical protein